MGHLYQPPTPLLRLKECHGREGSNIVGSRVLEACYERPPTICDIAVVLMDSQQLWSPAQDQANQLSSMEDNS